MDDDKFYEKYGMSRKEFKIRNILALVIAGIYLVFIYWAMKQPNGESQTMLVLLATGAVMILVLSITKRKR